MLELELRVQRYRALHADPGIACRTDFFAAAAFVTGLVQRMGPSEFICALGAWLEDLNLRRAAAIRAGLLYASGSVHNNTQDFVRVEQGAVQLQLDRLRIVQPQRYKSEVAAVNRALCLAASVPGWLGEGDAFRRSLLAARREGRCQADFGSQRFRELLGLEIADALRVRRKGGGAAHWPTTYNW